MFRKTPDKAKAGHADLARPGKRRRSSLEVAGAVWRCPEVHHACWPRLSGDLVLHCGADMGQVGARWLQFPLQQPREFEHLQICPCVSRANNRSRQLRNRD